MPSKIITVNGKPKRVPVADVPPNPQPPRVGPYSVVVRGSKPRRIPTHGAR